MLPHTMSNLRHLLPIALSVFQEMSYFDQTGQENHFRKWFPVKMQVCGTAGTQSRPGVLLLVRTCFSHALGAISHIRIIDGRQVIMMEHQLSGFGPAG